MAGCASVSNGRKSSPAPCAAIRPFWCFLAGTWPGIRQPKADAAERARQPNGFRQLPERHQQSGRQVRTRRKVAFRSLAQAAIAGREEGACHRRIDDDYNPNSCAGFFRAIISISPSVTPAFFKIASNCFQASACGGLTACPKSPDRMMCSGPTARIAAT
jgi:hypothetical protein